MSSILSVLNLDKIAVLYDYLPKELTQEDYIKMLYSTNLRKATSHSIEEFSSWTDALVNKERALFQLGRTINGDLIELSVGMLSRSSLNNVSRCDYHIIHRALLYVCALCGQTLQSRVKEYFRAIPIGRLRVNNARTYVSISWKLFSLRSNVARNWDVTSISIIPSASSQEKYKLTRRRPSGLS